MRMTATGAKRLAFASDLTEAIARRARDTTVREVRTDRVELDEGTRQLIADLRARIEALETIPTAQLELTDALRAVLMMMREMENRAAVLEDESRVVRETLEDTLPVLRAIVAGQRG